MVEQPFFIHVNSSCGRYIRKKLCEKYNDNFIVHHINPNLWRKDVQREKIIRCWQFRDVRLKYESPLKKYSNAKLSDFNNIVPFVILREPVERYISENKNVENAGNDSRSYNITCKSLYIAFTGDYNNFFLDFTEVMYDELIVLLENIIVIPLNKIDKLSTFFEFNSEPEYKPKQSVITDDYEDLKQKNYFDCKLYEYYNNNHI